MKMAQELPDHLRLGAAGEDLAACTVARAGLRILDRNWRSWRHELDLVCEDGDTIVFVEVKTRRSADFGGPAGALGQRKRLALTKAAQAWLASHRAWSRPCRFDVVCVLATGENGAPVAEHIRNAFDSSETLRGGHSHWQPW